MYSFPGVAACGEPGCGSQRADDKSHLLFCCFGDIYSLTVNQDGVGERAEIIQSLSQLTLTALFTKESLSCDLFGLLIYIGKVV